MSWPALFVTALSSSVSFVVMYRSVFTRLPESPIAYFSVQVGGSFVVVIVRVLLRHRTLNLYIIDLKMTGRKKIRIKVHFWNIE